MVNIAYTKLGTSGLSISPIIVGCMAFGNKNFSPWAIEDEEVCIKILKKCFDNGLRTFDTADVYSNGKSEIILGKFIKKYNIPRERIVILSKVNGVMDYNNPEFSAFECGSEKYPVGDYVNSRGLSRKHILNAVERSVERLGTYIDVLQIHRFDPETPKEEIMKALHDVVEAGHTRYLGAYSMKATELAQLQFIAELKNWTKFISMQNYYHLAYREEEREMIPFCNDNIFGKIGVIPYSPIASGLLARPLETETERLKTDPIYAKKGLNRPSEADQETIRRVEELSKKYNVGMAAIATRWVLCKGANPIVGVNSEKRADDTLQALTFTLTDEEIKYLEEPYETKEEYKY